MAYLLQHDPNPQKRILGVTFTRKAAGEMQQRLEQLVPCPDVLQKRVTLGTFHSICATLLRWNGEILSTLPIVQRDMDGSSKSTNLNGDFTIIDEDEQLRILQMCLEKAKISLQDSDVPLKRRTMLERFRDYRENHSKGQGNPWHEFNFDGQGRPRPMSFTEQQQVVAKVYPLYRESLLSRNCLDYDDLILLTRDLLRHYPDIRKRFQRHWKHVLVDEFQEASQAQVELVKLWTSSSLLVVGDPDHAIYSWRGAHASSLDDFAKGFATCGKVETVFLMENYRSTSSIIEAAQRVISHQASGMDRLGADRLLQSMKPRLGAGPPPRVDRFDNKTAEAKFVVGTVKDALAVGKYTDSHSVAFIYRTNAQSRVLEEACVQENLPYVVLGSATSFYKGAEIKDCLCFLRWLLNGRDTVAMERALAIPKRRLGESALRELNDCCALVESYQKVHPDVLPSPPWTPLDVLISLAMPQQHGDPALPLPHDTFSTRSLKLFTEFARQMKALQTLAYQQPLEVVLRSVIETMELMPHFNKASTSRSEFENWKQNVEELQQATQKVHGPRTVLG